MIEERMVRVCTCERCGKEFIPLRCPECKRTSWNKAEAISGRPRKASEPIESQTLAEELPVEQASVQVIPARHMPPEKQQTRKQSKAKQSADNQQRIGKGTYCTHNFLVLPDGTTMCPNCKRA